MATRIALKSRKENQFQRKNVQQQMFFTYFESLCAAWDGGKDVVAVHGAQDKLGAVPDLDKIRMS